MPSVVECISVSAECLRHSAKKPPPVMKQKNIEEENIFYNEFLRDKGESHSMIIVLLLSSNL